MEINLEKIVLTKDINLTIDQDVVFDLELYHLPELKDLRNVHFSGKLYENEIEEIILSGDFFGDIIVLDAISLEEKVIKFFKNIDEKVLEGEESSKNYIDILDILWQNIVLEVPSRYTEVTDYSKYQGDGWRLISEEDLVVSKSPFAILKDKE